MSKWDKITNDIKKLDKNLRFEELAKALIKIGYTQNQPKGGSSHYTFRKKGKESITIPKSVPIGKVYIEMVKEAIINFESEADES